MLKILNPKLNNVNKMLKRKWELRDLNPRPTGVLVHFFAKRIWSLLCYRATLSSLAEIIIMMK